MWTYTHMCIHAHEEKTLLTYRSPSRPPEDPDSHKALAEQSTWLSSNLSFAAETSALSPVAGKKMKFLVCPCSAKTFRKRENRNPLYLHRDADSSERLWSAVSASQSAHLCPGFCGGWQEFLTLPRPSWSDVYRRGIFALIKKVTEVWQKLQVLCLQIAMFTTWISSLRQQRLGSHTPHFCLLFVLCVSSSQSPINSDERWNEESLFFQRMWERQAFFSLSSFLFSSPLHPFLNTSVPLLISRSS